MPWIDGHDIAWWLGGVAGQPAGQSLRGRRGWLGIWLVGEKQQGLDCGQEQSGQDRGQEQSGVVGDLGFMRGPPLVQALLVLVWDVLLQGLRVRLGLWLVGCCSRVRSFLRCSLVLCGFLASS